MAKKRKTLPKDFEEILGSGDLGAMKAVFDRCEIDAYLGSYRRTALFFEACPDAMLRWLVEQGADVHAQDSSGYTALGHRASRGRHEQMPLLVELGADADGGRIPPLYTAARAARVEAVQALVDLGADIEKPDPSHGRTPLLGVLVASNNIDLPRTVRVARMLLDAGARIPEGTEEAVRRLGVNFERVRATVSDEFRQSWGAALEELYAMFDVEPVAAIVRHDGVSTISVPSGSWQQQFNALWDHLVPPGGACQTVQGEVIRIAGRVGDELLRNGGANWDADHRAMLDEWLRRVAGGTPLGPEETGTVVAALRPGVVDEDAVDRLSRLAVDWVRANPEPVRLGAVGYSR